MRRAYAGKAEHCLWTAKGPPRRLPAPVRCSLPCGAAPLGGRGYMKRFTALVLLGSVAMFGLVSCGDDDESADATDNVLHVTEDDYSFAIDDDVKAGSVTIDVQNSGDELHMFGACELKDGKTEADVQTALQAEDEEALG